MREKARVGVVLGLLVGQYADECPKGRERVFVLSRQRGRVLACVQSSALIIISGVLSRHLYIIVLPLGNVRVRGS